MSIKRGFLITTILLTIFLLQGVVFAEAEEAEEHFQKGHRFYLKLKSEPAESEFKEALRLDPKLSDAHYYLGSIYFKQERYNEAIGQCRQALEIEPGDLKSSVILGLCLQQLGLHDEAIEALQTAVQFHGHSAAVHSALGLAYCAKQDFAKAEEEYDILKVLDPDLAEDLLDKIKLQGR